MNKSIWMDQWHAGLADRAARQPGWADAHNGARVDAVIVGAGLAGLTLAYRLASGGMKVVVLEAHHVGYGASLRNAGFCTASAPVSAAAALKAHGPVAGAALLRWFFDAPLDVRALLHELGADGGWRAGARMVLAHTAAEASRLQSEAHRIRHLLGRQMAFLDGDATRARLGHGNFAGALLDPDSASLNPALLLGALLQGCVDAGVQVVQEAAVEAIRRTGARYAVEFSGGLLDAARVVIATNGYTGKLGFGVHKLIIPVGSFIIASKPVPAASPLRAAMGTAVCATASRFPNYFRFTPDGRLLFGGRRSLSHETATGVVAQELLRDARRLLPAFEFELDRCWGGRLGFTANREPLMGRLDDQLYFTGGCCGHGIPTSIASANALARHLLGAAGAMPVFYRDKLPLSVVPRIATLLLPAIGTYYRVRDRLDAMESAVRF